jgi:hypothetical protein
MQRGIEIAKDAGERTPRRAANGATAVFDARPVDVTMPVQKDAPIIMVQPEPAPPCAVCPPLTHRRKRRHHWNGG